jgi:hypothetical protein
LEDIDPKPTEAIDLITHVHLSILDEPLLLPVIHQTKGHLGDIVRIEGFLFAPRFQGPVDPEDRRSSYLDVNIGSFLSKGL